MRFLCGTICRALFYAFPLLYLRVSVYPIYDTTLIIVAIYATITYIIEVFRKFMGTHVYNSLNF